MVLSVRAADPITVTNYSATVLSGSSGGACFQPDCSGGTTQATICCFQPIFSGGTTQATTGRLQSDCSSGTMQATVDRLQPDCSGGTTQAATCCFQSFFSSGTFQATSGCFQPMFSGGTLQAATGGCQPDCSGGTTQAAVGRCQPDCGCCNFRCSTGCGIVGGAEVAFLKPYFNNNSALYRNATTSATIIDGEFITNYNASPRIWLGYEDCGFGGRIRYWVYDQGADPQVGVQSDDSVTFFAPGISIGSLQTENPGDKISTSEHLHMYTLDAEITQCLQMCCWDVMFGGGLRDASVHIDRTNAYIAAGDTAPSEVATIGNHFDGVGPTVFTELRRPFGCHGLAFAGSLRGSLLYGTKSLRATDATAMQTQTFDQTVNGCLGVAELSLGLEWAKDVSRDTSVFAQALWENQIWTNMGNSTGITGDNLGLGGFTFAVGIYR
jgi:hypothetical protein